MLLERGRAAAFAVKFRKPVQRCTPGDFAAIREARMPRATPSSGACSKRGERGERARQPASTMDQRSRSPGSHVVIQYNGLA